MRRYRTKDELRKSGGIRAVSGSGLVARHTPSARNAVATYPASAGRAPDPSSPSRRRPTPRAAPLGVSSRRPVLATIPSARSSRLSPLSPATLTTLGPKKPTPFLTGPFLTEFASSSRVSSVARVRRVRVRGGPRVRGEPPVVSRRGGARGGGAGDTTDDRSETGARPPMKCARTRPSAVVAATSVYECRIPVSPGTSRTRLRTSP